MNRLIFSILMLLFLSTGCKNSAGLTSSNPLKMSSKQLQKNMEAADFDFSFFQAKAKVNYNDGQMSQSFTANFRIQQNEKIWISLTGPFSIEGARVLITKNNIQIIDRLNGKYYNEPFDFINNYLPFQTDLSFIQSLIVGNTFQEEWTKQKVEYKDNFYSVDDEFSGINATYEVSDAFKYQSVRMKESTKARSIELNFDNYNFVEEQLFSMLRKIQFNDAGKLTKVELDFTKVKKEKELDFPFEVPEKMKN